MKRSQLEFCCRIGDQDPSEMKVRVQESLGSIPKVTQIEWGRSLKGELVIFITIHFVDADDAKKIDRAILRQLGKVAGLSIASRKTNLTEIFSED